MLTLYRALLYLALPAVLLRLVARALQDRRYFERLAQRFGFRYARPRPGGVWVHAVSVGEVHAAVPLLRHLLEKYPHMPVSVTTMTPTGADRVRRIFADRVAHYYLPYDYPDAMRRFLSRLRPRLAVIMETEIWPNLIAACHARGIPLLYVNARISKRAHRGYRRIQKLIGPSLQKINRFAAQSRADAKRLIRLGAPRAAVMVTASLKFDMEIGADRRAAAAALRRDFGARAVWLAGSTHAGEESQILDAFARVKKTLPQSLLVVAPRHPRRFAAVCKLCRQRGYRAARRSNSRGRLDAETDIYIGDTMGELPTLIAASDLAFIGGSLVPIGGHNVLEASAAGVPVIFGRHMFNFAEIAALLLRNTAGVQIMNAEELAEVVLRWLTDAELRERYARRGLALMQKHRGAARQVRAMLDQFLAAEATVGEQIKK